ncbi:MAG: bifunctional riboflavin kinase/FAD synthetase [Agathobacter sp.]|nr:bifunctional riboflavin kinase/FAD synthetase [Agathobacter sp.]
MKYINNTLTFKIEEPTVITFGKFDGLHRGHELLMKTLFQKREVYGYQTVVFTFDIPPRNKVNEMEAKVLTTNAEKLHIFEREGIDYLLECPFTPEVMNMKPEEFLKWVVTSLNVKCIVAGEDFHFGSKRQGDHVLIRQMAEELEYEACIFPKVQENNRDISSTYVREEISKGNLEMANFLLGYEFLIKGEVIHGNALGRKMGMPTINLAIPKEKLLPPNGVYVSRVEIDGEFYRGISNVGRKPTIERKTPAEGEDPVLVETYIFDWDKDLYGQEVVVSLLHYVRSEQKFDGIEELSRQMKKDLQKAEEYYENITKMC